MSVSKLGLAAVVAAATGALVIGGAALANASTGTAGRTGGQTAATGGHGDAGYSGGGGYGGGGGHGGPGHGGRPGGGGPGSGTADTPVTGDQLGKVTAAVTAKDSAVTVTRAQKDPDGSYDVFGTRAGAPVRFEVSADLKTITLGTVGGHGGPGGAGGGPGGHGRVHTPVTGDELAKVTAAVTAKDSAVTVTTVRKDADGSYDVLGTKAGAPVMLAVSADLKTITLATGHAGRGPRGSEAPGQASGQAPGSSTTRTPTSTPSTN